MVKCAAHLCRSGYALTKAEKAKKLAQRTVSVFSFPKDKELRARWVLTIGRNDSAWNPDHCGVCELHFREEDFCQTTRRKNERQRKFMKTGVVPSIFESREW